MSVVRGDGARVATGRFFYSPPDDRVGSVSFATRTRSGDESRAVAAKKR